MDRAAGQNAAVFAADGRARHRIVRAGVAAGIALLAVWLIALALGALGGFGSLPALPRIQSGDPHQAGPAPGERRSATPSPVEAAVKATPPSPSSTPAGSDRRQAPALRAAPKPSVTPVAPAGTTAAPRGKTSYGRELGTTKASEGGKPAGSPGNASGGSGAPGQLR